jgi:hypothetical protein
MGQATEGALGGGMLEVVGPAAHDLGEPDQHGSWMLL